jgi:3-phosphoshikimate 1-carboxyvinyltransferase
MPNLRTDVIITPAKKPLRGSIVVPGSKSITNRALLLAAMAKGTSKLTGALKSDDTFYMSEALKQMGVQVSEPDETSFTVTSNGKLQPPSAPLFLGNAGTATRFLCAAATSVEGKVIIDGDEYMRLRPIEPLVNALKSVGMNIEATNGCPPVSIQGTGRYNFEKIEISGNLSSQYLSALLMIAPLGNKPIEIALSEHKIGARGYIELTLSTMQAFGASYNAPSPTRWKIDPTGYRATDFSIEPDASTATYFWAMEALTGGQIDLGYDADSFTQPDAEARKTIALFPNLPKIIEGSQMQDAIPTLVVLAAFNKNPVRFTGIANLRVKECDRVAALADGLNGIKSGLAQVEGDDIIVNPVTIANLVECNTMIDTHADHRIAMSFALAGLKIAGIKIMNSKCVTKTYPGYWDALRSLGVKIEECTGA